MGRRRGLGCLLGLALVAAVGCKDKGAPTKADPATSPPSAVELDKRCEQVAKVCGDQAKHVDKILDACKLAAIKQVEKGCTATAIATYDCYLKDVCGSGDKVWALDDVRVLADRHGKCAAEQAASRACSEKGARGE